jgi:hypothetical protein
VVIAVLSYIWTLFKIWIETLFVVPVQNWEMLWLLVPVWIAWFFSEFFQEKTGTSMGNAITNAVVVLWGGIDCSRQTVKLIAEKTIHSTIDIAGRFTLIAAIFIYGVVIVRLGLKGNKIIKHIGRVRIVTYVFAMFVPVIYNAIPFSIEHLIATIVFFPLYYFIIEFIDWITPNPVAVEQDIKDHDDRPQAGISEEKPVKQKEAVSLNEPFRRVHVNMNANPANPAHNINSSSGYPNTYPSNYAPYQRYGQQTSHEKR